MTKKTEEREAEVWLNEGNGEMDADALNLIAVTGFNNCGDELCLSQKTVGEDACACVRATFPSRDHYQLYIVSALLIFGNAQARVNRRGYKRN